jgi:Kef-type K+ transport system membrane component KefB
VEVDHIQLLLILLIGIVAPLIAEMPSGFRLPVVVIEIVLGILIGPHGLGLMEAGGVVELLAQLGLAFLLFLVGLEIDLSRIHGRPLVLAAKAWGVAVLAAALLTSVLGVMGILPAPPLVVAIAVTTTALGVLMPILRDSGELETSFGMLVVALAAVSEFGPLVVISLVLAPTHSPVVHTLFVGGFLVAAFFAASFAVRMRSSPWIESLGHTLESSSQLPVRACVLLQILLVALAEKFGLHMVLGAFAAGMIVRLASEGEKGVLLRQKLDALGYGYLIPLFFISVGMTFDVGALASTPLAPVQIVAYLGLFLAVRGAGLFLYREEIDRNHRWPFLLYTATGLPLIVVISELGMANGILDSEQAAALVSAGMISVLLFPMLASLLLRKARVSPP